MMAGAMGIGVESGRPEGVKLEVLDHSPLPAMVIHEDGQVVYCNRAMSQRGSVVLAEGKLEPGYDMRKDTSPFVRERLELARDLGPERPVMAVRNLIDGEQVVSYMTLLPEGTFGLKRAVLVIQERVHGELNRSDFPGAEFREPSRQSLGALSALSRRELEVLALIGQGLTAAQIAERIHRSEETVNSHKSALLRKLGCRNASQLALVAHRAGLKYEDGARFVN